MECLSVLFPASIGKIHPPHRRERQPPGGEWFSGRRRARKAYYKNVTAQARDLPPAAFMRGGEGCVCACLACVKMSQSESHLLFRREKPAGKKPTLPQAKACVCRSMSSFQRWGGRPLTLWEKVLEGVW